MEYMPTVVQAVAGKNGTVYVYFSDGTVRLVDVKPLIESGGVFGRLADESFFNEALTVMNGTVAWDVTGTRDETKCIDLDPCTIYKTAVVVPDPLRETA